MFVKRVALSEFTPRISEEKYCTLLTVVYSGRRLIIVYSMTIIGVRMKAYTGVVLVRY